MMLWKRWWVFTGLTAIVLGGIGVWAKGKLIGSEPYPSPTAAPTSARATPPAPFADSADPVRPAAPSKLSHLPPPTVMQEPGVVAAAPTTDKMAVPAPGPTSPPPGTGEPPMAAPVPPTSAVEVVPSTPTPLPSPTPTLPAPSSAGLPGPGWTPPAPPVNPPAPPVTVPAPGPVPSATTTEPIPTVPPPTSGTGVEPTRLRIPETPPATPSTSAPVPSPWTLRVEIVNGRPQLEARNGKDVRFTVDCDRLNLQAPDGTITAQGKIKVIAPDLEGLCDALTINWKEDRIILEKEVRLKCQKEGQEVELTGERLTVKLTAIAPSKSAAATSHSSTRPEPTVTERPSSRTRKVSRPMTPANQPIDPFDGPQGVNE